MRNQRGITLIALVITIIVLLILAGVSIAMLTGDNGILSNAQRSSRETAIANAKEKVSTAVNEAMTNYYANVYVDDGSDNILDKVEDAINSCEGTVDGVTIEYTDVASTTDGSLRLKFGEEVVAEGTVDAETGAFAWTTGSESTNSIGGE